MGIVSDHNIAKCGIENFLAFGSVYVNDTDRDRFGNLYVVGSFTNPNFVIGGTFLVNYGGSTIFILKFDKDLNVIWGKSFGNKNVEPSGIRYLNTIDSKRCIGKNTSDVNVILVINFDMICSACTSVTK